MSQELFTEPPARVARLESAIRPAPRWGHFFLHVDRALRLARAAFRRRHRGSARSGRAVAFVTARLNGEDGLGGIYPAMANAMMMFDALGYRRRPSRTAAIAARGAARSCCMERRRGLIASPACRRSGTPRWPAHALPRPGGNGEPAWPRPLAGCAPRQVLDVVGDWAAAGRACRPGGWAFQYENPHYPGRGRHRGRGAAAAPRPTRRYAEAIARATRLDRGHAVRDGGWGAFDAGQHAPLPEPYPLRRSRRAARSADRGCDGALHGCLAQMGASRMRPAIAPRAWTAAARTGAGRRLVRALGHQLHLRHLVGAVRAESRGRGQRRALHAARRRWLLRASTRMAAGARTGELLAPDRGRAGRVARPRRPPGRCWG